MQAMKRMGGSRFSPVRRASTAELGGTFVEIVQAETAIDRARRIEKRGQAGTIATVADGAARDFQDCWVAIR